MKKQLSHSDKFEASCLASTHAQERRQLIEAYGNDKVSLEIALREWSTPIKRNIK